MTSTITTMANGVFNGSCPECIETSEVEFLVGVERSDIDSLTVTIRVTRVFLPSGEPRYHAKVGSNQEQYVGGYKARGWIGFEHDETGTGLEWRRTNSFDEPDTADRAYRDVLGWVWTKNLLLVNAALWAWAAEGEAECARCGATWFVLPHVPEYGAVVNAPGSILDAEGVCRGCREIEAEGLDSGCGGS